MIDLVINPASPADLAQLLPFYRGAAARPDCPWDEWYPDPATLTADQSRPAGEVVRLLVVPAWENQGMGRRLLADAMERLAGMGCRSCRILVGRENHRALRSYAKLGFGRTGRARLYDTDFDCFEQELF